VLISFGFSAKVAVSKSGDCICRGSTNPDRALLAEVVSSEFFSASLEKSPPASLASADPPPCH